MLLQQVRKTILALLVLFFLVAAARGQSQLLYRSFNPTTGTCSDASTVILYQTNPSFTIGTYKCVGGVYVALNITSGPPTTIVDVASFATSGDGTQGTPWLGWDTAITWSADTEYKFRKGWFSYATSPNFLKTNIALVGEAGTFLKHTGTGNAFTMQSPNPGVDWIQRARVSNFTIVGNFSTLTGSGSATNGTNTVTGTGTLFLSQVAVGDSLCFESAMATECQIVTVRGGDTSITVSANWVTNHSGGMHIGKTQRGVYLNGVRNATFTNVSVKDVADSCVYAERLVTNTFERFVCSYHEPIQSTGFVIRPQNGIVLDTDTTTETFIEPIIEGMQSIGIWTKNGSYGNTFINGTSEGNPGKGAVFASVGNVVINTDFEANTGNDIDVAQSRNTFIQIVSAGLIHLTAGQASKFIGGELTNLTIDAGVDITTIDGSLINGTYTDSNGALTTTKLFSRVMTLDGGIRYDTMLGNVIPHGNVLTINAGNINTDARIGSNFFVSINNNFTITNPTNATFGNLITWTIENSSASGPFTITWGNKFKCPDGKMLPPAVPSNGRMFIQASYFTSNDLWSVGQCVPKAATDTFAGAATKVVTFTVNEPDTNYRVMITGDVNETFWVTTKLTTGFTLNSSNAASTANIEWSLVR